MSLILMQGTFQEVYASIPTFTVIIVFTEIRCNDKQKGVCVVFSKETTEFLIITQGLKLILQHSSMFLFLNSFKDVAHYGYQHV